MPAATFECPDCGRPARVIRHCPSEAGEICRRRECPECGPFDTVENGHGEQFLDWYEEPEIEPLDLAALDPIRERRERLRLLFICCKSVVSAELRPAALRGGNGYTLVDSGGDFYGD